MLTTSEHRAATISAPKSVSLAALIGGDDRIRDAYRESVNEALKELENICKRVAAAHPRVTTNDSSE
jgi:conjugative relaxase-like TrwC/TraI family protein